jgi:acyl carrier protein
MEGPAEVTATADAIRDWIVARIAILTGVPPAEIDVGAPLCRHGLDSIALIALASDLEKRLGYRFRENPVDASTTIESLSRYVAERVKTGGGQAGSSG